MNKNIFSTLCLTLLLGATSIDGYANSPNIAKYRVVTHSSSANPHQCGHLVVDGSTETYWEAGEKDKDQWLLIDLAESNSVDGVTIDWGKNYAIGYSVSLLGDDANGSATEVYSTTNGEGGVQEISFKSQKARYVKIEIDSVVEPIRGCVINEVEVSGVAPERFLPSSINEIEVANLSLNGSTWRVQNAMFVGDDSQAVSSTNYDDTEWIPATVPGTVLGDYYNFGAVPDPLYGDNMHQISDKFFSGNDFWYRTRVKFPSEVESKRAYLNFAGINYKSEIYFNGEYLGRIDGAFHRGEFEVTGKINKGGENVVAVYVHNNDHWVSGSFKIIRKQLGDRVSNGDMLGLDGPTSLASAGWNWLPIIKGRNNGIWNNVTVTAREDVAIVDPWVETDLELPDTTRANVIIRTSLKNNSEKSITGKLLASFDKVSVELPVSLEVGEQKEVTLDPSQFKALSVKNPKLWWPNGYGEQNLHDLKLEFVAEGVISDSQNVRFGIREFGYDVIDDVLFISCNGYKIQLKGGNWGLPEAMMRLDKEGYSLRAQLHKEANFNMIRNWLGMTNHREFYEACDENGILIFDDFWIANPKNGPDPRPHADAINLFMDNARDRIKWSRTHASLVLYCGRNEGLPPVEYDWAMRHECEALDGTRYYVPNSADTPLSGYGPYDVKNIEWYFNRRGTTFHSEIGIIAIPEVESFRKMMPEENLWPINDMWAIHDYQYPRSFQYTEMLNKRYGECSSIEEYSRKAQLQNYETGRAMFESLQSNRGSGTLLWMSQSAWPSLICQLYDHYLEYTSSYFAVKKGCSPIHVFYDSDKQEIRVANNTKYDLKKLSVKATLYNAKGETLWSEETPIDVALNSVVTAFPYERAAGDKVEYLVLGISQKGKLVSDNFYWLANSKKNCQDLNDLKAADVAITLKEGQEGDYYTAAITLTNNSDEVSLINKIKLKERVSGESILPVHFDDDYVSLLPGAERTINIKVAKKYLDGKDAQMHLEGWNTTPKVIDICK